MLANYSGRCAISGIDIPDLLVASHIIPWSENKEERLNPANGICLSAHFDSAFDKGYLYFDKDFQVVIGPKLKQYATQPYYFNWFKQFEGKQMKLPVKYLPSLDFLEWHCKYISQ